MYRVVGKGFSEITPEIPKKVKDSHVITCGVILPGRRNNKCKDLRIQVPWSIQERSQPVRPGTGEPGKCVQEGGQ